MSPTPVSSIDVGLLLSGGLDSCILLAHLLRQGRGVRPFFVRCGLFWEKDELAALQSFVQSLSPPSLEKLVICELPLGDVYGEHWSTTGLGTPAADTPDDAVYLPGRNALLAIKPMLWCAMHGIEELALAVLASNPFPDATAEFFRDFEAAMARATGRRVRLTHPFARLHKADVMELGRGLPLEATFSCIAPVGGLHCGRCNKCAERREAFRAVALADPTRYA